MKDTLAERLETIKKNLLDRNDDKKYSNGLVLSGGAAHGFAHLGVIKAMEENGMEPDVLSGASAGSIVGCMYADGHQPEEILEIFKKNKLFSFVNFKLKRLGLFEVSGLRKILEKNLKAKKIEDLSKPLIIAATNITKASIVYFDKGNLIDLVIASSSIPVVFKPIKIDGEFFVDGGVTDNFPVEPIKEVCKQITGVNVNPLAGFDPEESGLGQLAIHTFQMSIASGLANKKKDLTYYIEPEKMAGYSYVNLEAGEEMMEIGYEAAKKIFDK